MKTTKTKTPQPKTPEKTQLRDSFYTPAYATQLIVPFLKGFKTLWECGNGSGRMSRVFENEGFNVIKTDISGNNIIHNFITDNPDKYSNKIDAIVTNIPFSLKMEFINQGFKIGKPFAFLIPMDMSSYLWKCFKDMGLQAIVPERRIDYLTPNIIERINVGEGLKPVIKKYYGGKKITIEKFLAEETRQEVLDLYNSNKKNYSILEEIPYEYLKAYSSSDFHSQWIVYKFNLPKDTMYVPLSLKDKKNIL